MSEQISSVSGNSLQSHNYDVLLEVIHNDSSISGVTSANKGWFHGISICPIPDLGIASSLKAIVSRIGSCFRGVPSFFSWKSSYASVSGDERASCGQTQLGLDEQSNKQLQQELLEVAKEMEYCFKKIPKTEGDLKKAYQSAHHILQEAMKDGCTSESITKARAEAKSLVLAVKEMEYFKGKIDQTEAPLSKELKKVCSCAYTILYSALMEKERVSGSIAQARLQAAHLIAAGKELDFLAAKKEKVELFDRSRKGYNKAYDILNDAINDQAATYKSIIQAHKVSVLVIKIANMLEENGAIVDSLKALPDIREDEAINNVLSDYENISSMLDNTLNYCLPTSSSQGARNIEKTLQTVAAIKGALDNVATFYRHYAAVDAKVQKLAKTSFDAWNKQEDMESLLEEAALRKVMILDTSDKIEVSFDAIEETKELFTTLNISLNEADQFISDELECGKHSAQYVDDDPWTDPLLEEYRSEIK